jgi:tetratricopeptide (TPR) repeat protein
MPLTQCFFAVLYLRVSAAAGATGEAPAAGDDWTAQSVLAKKPEAEIALYDRSDGGKRTGVAFHAVYPIRVREQRDGRLRVFDGQREGWVDRGDFVLSRDAPAFFTERLRADPKDTRVLLLRGPGWMDLGENDKAVQDFTEVLRLKPDSSVAFLNRGTARFRKKEYDDALKDYTEAVRIAPENATAFYSRGCARLKKQDYDKAVEDLTEAVRLNPSFARAFYERGSVHFTRKEYDKAIPDYDEAVRLDPGYALAFNDRGVSRLRKSEFDLADKDFTEAVRLEPKNVAYNFNRGLARRFKKEYGKALEDFDEALRLDPNYHLALTNKAEVLATCRDAAYRDGSKAVELARKACELTGWKKGRPLDALAAAYAEVGDFNAAVKWEEEAIKDPEFDQVAGPRLLARVKLYKLRKPLRQ